MALAQSLSQDDLRRLGLSLILALVMSGAGAAAVYFSMQMHEEAIRQQASAQSSRMESQRRLSQASSEEAELKEKIARFNALERHGILGEEQRLDWVELIRDIRAQRKLLDIDYEIAPQRPIDAALLPGASGRYDFLLSAMQLRMKLLHEEDLLNFISDLRQRARAFIRVKSCDVKRPLRIERPQSGLPAQLDAECVLEWITIRARKDA